MERIRAFLYLDSINQLVAQQADRQQIQSLLTLLAVSGFPVEAVVKNGKVVRYRPVIASQQGQK